MNTQGTKTVKANIKTIVLMTLSGVVALSLTACGGGGDKSGAVPANEQGGNIVLEAAMNQGAGVVSMDIYNQARVPSSRLFYTFSNQGDYQVYDGVSNTDWCTPQSCPNSCKEGHALDRVQDCYIYIDAKNVLGYGQNKAINDFLTITNGSKVTKYNLKMDGYLYNLSTSFRGGSEESLFLAKTKKDKDWNSILVNPSVQDPDTIFSTLAISQNGVLFTSDANKSNLYYSNSRVMDSFNLDASKTSINPIKVITFDTKGRVVIGGFGSNKLWRYDNGWTSIASIPNLIDIMEIATDSQGHIYLQGSTSHGNSIYTNKSGSFVSIGQPSSETNVESSGLIVDKQGVLHVSFINSTKTYSYSNGQWSTESTVKPNATAQDYVRSLSIDVNGNMFAGVSDYNAVYEKAVNSHTWTLISPENKDTSDRFQLANGVLLSISDDS